MKILLDMNPSPRWVGVLLHAGFETQHCPDVGRPDASDPEIMSFAAKSGAVLVTHDLDFSAILAATQGTKPSVVQIRARNVTLSLSLSRSSLR
jgi:predicted nuclease of predicted toxin-antitoxin system